MTVSLGAINGSTSVLVADIELTLSASDSIVYSGDSVTFDYDVTNTGAVTLTDVIVADDAGTPGDNSDDITVCQTSTLVPGQQYVCHRASAPVETATHLAVVTGRDSLGGEHDDSDWTSVSVISPGVAVAVSADPSIIYSGDSVNYTYRITNTGDTVLTEVVLADDNGTPGDTSDDLTPCGEITLTVGSSADCARGANPTQSLSTMVTAVGRDPLDSDVSAGTSTVIDVIWPAVALSVNASQSSIDSGETVTFTYDITNTGDTQLSDVTLTNASLPVCVLGLLDAGATQICERSAGLTAVTTETIVSTATVAGLDPLHNEVTATSSTTVEVRPPFTGTDTLMTYLPLVMEGS